MAGLDTGITIGVPETAVGPDVLVSEDVAGSMARSVHDEPAPAAQDTPLVDLGMPAFDLPSASPDAGERTEFRWLMASNVCKHCTNAGCLDVCPTGALFRTEFGTVVVQDDICNGCGYCVAGCPFGVIDRRIGDKTPLVGTRQAGDQERRHRPEVHALLRPARRRPDPGVRQGLPDAVDPVRRRRRAARAGREAGRPTCRPPA